MNLTNSAMTSTAEPTMPRTSAILTRRVKTPSLASEEKSKGKLTYGLKISFSGYASRVMGKDWIGMSF